MPAVAALGAAIFLSGLVGTFIGYNNPADIPKNPAQIVDMPEKTASLNKDSVSKLDQVPDHLSKLFRFAVNVQSENPRFQSNLFSYQMIPLPVFLTFEGSPIQETFQTDRIPNLKSIVCPGNSGYERFHFESVALKFDSNYFELLKRLVWKNCKLLQDNLQQLLEESNKKHDPVEVSGHPASSCSIKNYGTVKFTRITDYLNSLTVSNSAETFILDPSSSRLSSCDDIVSYLLETLPLISPPAKSPASIALAPTIGSTSAEEKDLYDFYENPDDSDKEWTDNNLLDDDDDDDDDSGTWKNVPESNSESIRSVPRHPAHNLKNRLVSSNQIDPEFLKRGQVPTTPIAIGSQSEDAPDWFKKYSKFALLLEESSYTWKYKIFPVSVILTFSREIDVSRAAGEAPDLKSIVCPNNHHYLIFANYQDSHLDEYLTVKIPKIIWSTCFKNVSEESQLLAQLKRSSDMEGTVQTSYEFSASQGKKVCKSSNGMEYEISVSSDNKIIRVDRVLEEGKKQNIFVLQPEKVSDGQFCDQVLLNEVVKYLPDSVDTVKEDKQEKATEDSTFSYEKIGVHINTRDSPVLYSGVFSNRWSDFLNFGVVTEEDGVLKIGELPITISVGNSMTSRYFQCSTENSMISQFNFENFQELQHKVRTICWLNLEYMNSLVSKQKDALEQTQIKGLVQETSDDSLICKTENFGQIEYDSKERSVIWKNTVNEKVYKELLYIKDDKGQNTCAEIFRDIQNSMPAAWLGWERFSAPVMSVKQMVGFKSPSVIKSFKSPLATKRQGKAQQTKKEEYDQVNGTPLKKEELLKSLNLESAAFMEKFLTPQPAVEEERNGRPGMGTGKVSDLSWNQVWNAQSNILQCGSYSGYYFYHYTNDFLSKAFWISNNRSKIHLLFESSIQQGKKLVPKEQMCTAAEENLTAIMKANEP
jgi:hypothetical protein